MWGKGWGADTKGGRCSRPGLGLWPQTALPFGWLLRLYGCSSPLSLAQTVVWYCKLLFGKERKQILQMKKKAEMSCSFQTFVLCRIGGLVLSGCMPPTGVFTLFLHLFFWVCEQAVTPGKQCCFVGFGLQLWEIQACVNSWSAACFGCSLFLRWGYPRRGKHWYGLKFLQRKTGSYVVGNVSWCSRVTCLCVRSLLCCISVWGTVSAISWNTSSICNRRRYETALNWGGS